MLPDRVSNPGPLTYGSGALPIALRDPAHQKLDQVSILFPLAIRSRLVCHYLDTEGRVLKYQTERYQLILTYNASW